MEPKTGTWSIVNLAERHSQNLDVFLVRAHQICPDSRATRGNIDVKLSGARLPIEWSAAS
jgi:organic hydroperoxide reductase OsmC/OhrA